jgi:hypothetical protein
VGIQYNERGKALWQWGDNGDFKAFYIILPGSREQLLYFTHSPRGPYIAQQIADLFLGQQTTWLISWVRNGYANPYEIAYAAPYAVAALRALLLQHVFVHAAAIYRKEKQQHPAF